MAISTAPILVVGDGNGLKDIEYISGCREPGPSLLLRLPHKDILVVTEFEYSRAERAARETLRKRPLEVLSPERLPAKLLPDRRMSGWAIGLLRREKIKRVAVGASFPFGIAERLKKFHIAIRVTTDNPVPEREVKTGDEIRNMTEIMQATVIAMRRAIDTIRSSRADTTNGVLMLKGRALHAEDVQDVVHRTLMEHRAVCRDTIVACGKQGADPHERGQGPLRANELIVLDIFPEHMVHGYFADMTRTVVRGAASVEAKAMYRAVVAAQAAGLANVRPKATCRSVHKAVSDELVRRKFKSGRDENGMYGFTHTTGHGIGRDNHESPAIAWNTTRLRAGQVITVEPGLYYPHIGGVRIEDVVLVTRTGWRYLAPCEKTLEI